MKVLPFVASVPLAIALSAVAAQEVYKWVDKEGRVHYGDQPPRDAQAERLQLDTAASTDTDPSETLRRLLEQADAAAERRAAARRAAATARETEAAVRTAQDQRCFTARTQLAVVQEQRPVYRDEQGQLRIQWVRDAYSGEREYIDDATRAAEVARIRQEIAASCQNPNDAEAQEYARREWILSELCASARAELASLQRQPAARVSDFELGQRRAAVSRYCAE